MLLVTLPVSLSAITDREITDNRLLLMISTRMKYTGTGYGINNGDFLYDTTPVQLKDQVYSTDFWFKGNETITRQKFYPELVIGGIYKQGDMTYNFHIGYLPPLAYTVDNSNSTVLMQEKSICPTVNTSRCPLAALGFVEQSTGDGIYAATRVSNFSYHEMRLGVDLSYRFWGNGSFDLSAGSGVDYVFSHALEKYDFLYGRTDTSDYRVVDGNLTVSSSSLYHLQFTPYVFSDFKGVFSGVFLKAGLVVDIAQINRKASGYTDFITDSTVIATVTTSDLPSLKAEETVFAVGAFIESGVIF